SATQVKARVDDMVEMTGLSGHAHKRPSGLSGGQQQRVALARALACEPPVLLLDEPFSALDKNLRGQMQDEMRRIHRDTGTTFVFVTHDQSEALALSSRVAIFEKGRLQQLAPPREVYERPANRFVAEFLGDINILPVVAGQIEGRAVDAPGPQGDLAIRPE
ncbi:MAG: ABC transporter ATP-binding protein, partial [Paracoccaceae bacterium]